MLQCTTSVEEAPIVTMYYISGVLNTRWRRFSISPKCQTLDNIYRLYITLLGRCGVYGGEDETLNPITSVWKVSLLVGGSWLSVACARTGSLKVVMSLGLRDI